MSYFKKEIFLNLFPNKYTDHSNKLHKTTLLPQQQTEGCFYFLNTKKLFEAKS